MVHDTITDLDGDYARVACGALEASPDPWSGDSWSGDKHDDTSEDGFNKCKQVERDACCDQRASRSYATINSVCNVLGCNLKKCGKRFADSSSSEDIIEWKGDEWSGDDHDPTANPVWKGDEWGDPDPTRRPTKYPTKRPTKRVR